MLIVILIVILLSLFVSENRKPIEKLLSESLCQTTHLNWLIFNFSLLVLETILLEPVQRKYILTGLLSSKICHYLKEESPLYRSNRATCFKKSV